MIFGILLSHIKETNYLWMPVWRAIGSQLLLDEVLDELGFHIFNQ